jgi:hypothetical protein
MAGVYSVDWYALCCFVAVFVCGMSLRMVKTILHELCKLKGIEIYK